MDEKTATRDRILQAAMNRIKHYGYGKTTMAEIAADCDMSPGNIYRFFEAKIDIAEAMARKHYAEEQAEMAAIARKKEWPADKRLREIFFKRMRDSYAMFEENAKILEVAEVLVKERPLFSNEQLALERVFLSALLEEGEKAGLFAPADHMFNAEMMQSATMKFGVPQLFSKLTLPKLERELEGVLNLILNGIYARK
ncbi:TetR/AcrR family transcriptional regulator [Vitreimonas flagellata]|uniref:TetR/AcrR family transcriptional regulator n=1 Tax=Vitreimonas flagellata TaxID=2560861 RepID=UPI0010750DC1|nr:TetR/AcrR family transcriptional regulator [Vitreimonas flagellata]